MEALKSGLQQLSSMSLLEYNLKLSSLKDGIGEKYEIQQRLKARPMSSSTLRRWIGDPSIFQSNRPNLLCTEIHR